jgi:hypothetical protein
LGRIGIWLSASSTSRSGRCLAHWIGVAVAWMSRTSSCWSCATSWTFGVARSRGRSFAPLIVPCSRRRPATCHAPPWRASGHPAHAVALASSARAREVATAARPARTPAHASRRAGRGAAAAAGESALGPPADQRRAGQTRVAGIANDGTSAACPRRARPGPARSSGPGWREFLRTRRRASLPATSSPSKACSWGAQTRGGRGVGFGAPG